MPMEKQTKITTFNFLFTPVFTPTRATSANSALIHQISNIKDNIRQSWGAGGRKFESSHPDKHTKALPAENG